MVGNPRKRPVILQSASMPWYTLFCGWYSWHIYPNSSGEYNSTLIVSQLPILWQETQRRTLNTLNAVCFGNRYFSKVCAGAAKPNYVLVCNIKCSHQRHVSHLQPLVTKCHSYTWNYVNVTTICTNMSLNDVNHLKCSANRWVIIMEELCQNHGCWCLVSLRCQMRSTIALVGYYKQGLTFHEAKVQLAVPFYDRDRIKIIHI